MDKLGLGERRISLVVGERKEEPSSQVYATVGRGVAAQGLGGVTSSHLTPESPGEYQRRASVACSLILSAESNLGAWSHLSPQSSRVRGGVAISVRADSRVLS